MLAYHGTIADGAECILSGGRKSKSSWHVSDDNMLYLWCPDVFIDENEASDMEDAKIMAIQQAFESAQISAAISESPQKELVVLEFDIPIDYIYEDLSCENMDLARCTREIKYSDYAINKYTCNHDPRLDLLILSRIIHNLYLNTGYLSNDFIDACKGVLIVTGKPC